MRKLSIESAAILAISPIWTTGICNNHTAKMEGMTSISTTCHNNAFCHKMAKIDGTVCQKCYAERMAKMYGDTFTNKYEQAGKELSNRILTFEELPKFGANTNVVRIEAFGELINTIHAINYINIIRANPWINFAWWTKRPNLIARALKEMGIEFPDNCNVIYSNPYLDTMPKIQPFSFISGYFTVWTSEQKAAENSCVINCGKRKCKNCLNCYDAHDGIFFINELKK